MNWSAALTRWHHHIRELEILKKRYNAVWYTLPLEIFQYRSCILPEYRKFYDNLMEGICCFPRQKYWQYASILSPNILEREENWYEYENIFFWEKEEVLELLEIDYDPEEEIFTRGFPKGLMELAHGCYVLSEKSLVRHVPEVYVVVFADGSAYFCDKERNRLVLPEYISLSVEDLDGTYRITVKFLDINICLYKKLENVPENEFPEVFHVYVYDVVNTDL